MWLLFLRFDDRGQVVTMHVRCQRRSVADEIFGLAKHHGLTPTATLVEFASFRSELAIQPVIAPGVHQYAAEQFRALWYRVAESLMAAPE